MILYDIGVRLRMVYLAKQEGRNRVSVSHGIEKLPLTPFHLDWRNEWQSGNDEIDLQHQKLIEIGNHLANSSLEGADEEEIGDLLDLLLAGISEHFDYEERIMRAIDYPESLRHAEIHLSGR